MCAKSHLGQPTGTPAVNEVAPGFIVDVLVDFISGEQQ